MSEYRGPKSYSTETFCMLGELELSRQEKAALRAEIKNLKDDIKIARRDIAALQSERDYLRSELELIGNWMGAHAKELLEYKTPAEAAAELLEFYHAETSPPDIKPTERELITGLLDILEDENIFGMKPDEFSELVQDIVEGAEEWKKEVEEEIWKGTTRSDIRRRIKELKRD